MSPSGAIHGDDSNKPLAHRAAPAFQNNIFKAIRRFKLTSGLFLSIIDIYQSVRGDCEFSKIIATSRKFWARYTHFTPRSEPLGLLREELLITVVARDTKGEGHALTALESSLVSAVIEECTRAVTAEGYLPPTRIRWLDPGVFSQPNSTYGPSMLIDIDDGRPTEGEHIIGDLVERATLVALTKYATP